MITRENGIERVDIHFTPSRLREMMREKNPEYTRQVIAGSYCSRPRFDPGDILSIGAWAKSEADREGFVAKATVEVARGDRELAKLVLTLEPGEELTIRRLATEPDVVEVSSGTVASSFELRSFKGYSGDWK